MTQGVVSKDRNWEGWKTKSIDLPSGFGKKYSVLAACLSLLELINNLSLADKLHFLPGDPFNLVLIRAEALDLLTQFLIFILEPGIAHLDSIPLFLQLINLHQAPAPEDRKEEHPQNQKGKKDQVFLLERPEESHRMKASPFKPFEIICLLHFKSKVDFSNPDSFFHVFF